MVDNALRYGAGTIELEAAGRGRGGRDPRRSIAGAGFSAEFLDRGLRALQPRARRASATAAAASAWRSSATVARAHGGEAHAANRDGGGADVWLTLPCRGSH